jgi:hypothetical protein
MKAYPARKRDVGKTSEIMMTKRQIKRNTCDDTRAASPVCSTKK